MLEESFELLKQGAEGRLYCGVYLGKKVLAKERFKKNYRHPDLDNLLTKERMRSESRLIVRSKAAGVRTPTIYLVDFDRRIIVMEYFEKNITLKQYIINHCKEDEQSLNSLGDSIGLTVAKLHGSNIIHGDLTTSNMLLVPKETNISDWSSNIDLKNSDMVVIDFGLSRVDSSPEDKGVDLYVLERALLSTHSKEGDSLRKRIMMAYSKHSKGPGLKSVLDKYEEVRARGRKRTMVG